MSQNVFHLPPFSFYHLAMEPVRILQISYSMDLGGAESLIMNLYRHIDRSRVQFDFLLHCPEGSAYEKEIRELGGRIFRIPRYLLYNKLSYEKNLTSFLESHPEYRIIHDHLMDSASETLRVAGRMGRITIAHSHTADVPFSAGELLRSFLRRDLWKIADYRFACSEEAGKWLYRGKADFTVLRNGIETKAFGFDMKERERVRKELGIPESAFVVGTVGRMVRYKNQARLPGIIGELEKTGTDTRLLLVGDGPEKEEIVKNAGRLGVSDHLIFTGPRKDVTGLLMGMDAFVLPSLYEGLGIVLVEAQASGLPCIFTDSIPADVDIIPELVHRVALSDPDSTWARTLLDARPIENRETAAGTVEGKGYDIKTSASQLQEFYLSL